MGEIAKLAAAATAFVLFGVTTVLGITILREFANSTAVESGDVTNFITALTTIGAFAVLIAVVIMGKSALRIMKEK